MLDFFFLFTEICLAFVQGGWKDKRWCDWLGGGEQPAWPYVLLHSEHHHLTPTITVLQHSFLMFVCLFFKLKKKLPDT